MRDAARNLRTAERFLLAPPLAATFDSAPVALCDISAKGARFRHGTPIDTGTKSVLRLAVDESLPPQSLEAVIVWSHRQDNGEYVSGVSTYASPELMQSLLAQLRISNRTHRIEELRSTDRFYLTPSLTGRYNGRDVQIEDISARGARIVSPVEPLRGMSAVLHFTVPQSEIDVSVEGEVVWTAVKAVTARTTTSYRAGLSTGEKSGLLRLAIGRLCELGQASMDTQSLRLKLKIMRARARQMAPAYRQVESSGVPAEQYLLIQGVREELRLNPEEAMHWYRRARMIINDPSTVELAPPIASHPDALAVWEYLDRSLDPTVVGRAFELPG